MTVTSRGDDVHYDAGGWLLGVEYWGVSDCIRLAATTRHPCGRLESAGILFLDFNRDAIAMGRAVIRGECPPPVFADWVEEHPAAWRCPGEVRDAAVAVICSRLRSIA